MTIRVKHLPPSVAAQLKATGREHRTRKPPRREEAALQASVLRWLSLKGIWHERRNAGVLKVGRRWIRLGTPGGADVMVLHAGKVIFLELKASYGKLSAVQRAWGDRAVAAGAVYVVVRSLDALQEALAAEGVTPC